jgi:hypothetical protein
MGTERRVEPGTENKFTVAVPGPTKYQLPSKVTSFPPNYFAYRSKRDLGSVSAPGLKIWETSSLRSSLVQAHTHHLRERKKTTNIPSASSPPLTTTASICRVFQDQGNMNPRANRYSQPKVHALIGMKNS